MDSDIRNAIKFRSSLLVTYLLSQIKEDSKRTKINLKSSIFGNATQIQLENSGVFNWTFAINPNEENLSNDFDDTAINISYHGSYGSGIKTVGDLISCCNTMISVQRESTKKLRHKRHLVGTTSYVGNESFTVDCNSITKVISITSKPNYKSFWFDTMVTKYTFEQYNSNKEKFNADLEKHRSYVTYTETTAAANYRILSSELIKKMSGLKETYFGKTS